MIRHERYVGQTINKFSKRWPSRNKNWNKAERKDDSDPKDIIAALFNDP